MWLLGLVPLLVAFPLLLLLPLADGEGMFEPTEFILSALSLDITVPKASKDLLMNEPSFLLSCCPVALSEPARSHNDNVLDLEVPFFTSVLVKRISTMA